MIAPTEEQLSEALNRLDECYSYTMGQSNVYRKGIKPIQKRKDRPDGWIGITRKCIRSSFIPHRDGHFCWHIVEIEKDYIRISLIDHWCVADHKNKLIYLNQIDFIDDLAKLIIKRIHRKEGIKAVF